MLNNQGSYKVLLNERFCIVYLHGLINTEFRINLVPLFTLYSTNAFPALTELIYTFLKKLEAPYVVSLMVNCNNNTNTSDVVKEINSSTNNCS